MVKTEISSTSALNAEQIETSSGNCQVPYLYIYICVYIYVYIIYIYDHMWSYVDIYFSEQGKTLIAKHIPNWPLKVTFKYSTGYTCDTSLFLLLLLQHFLSSSSAHTHWFYFKDKSFNLRKCYNIILHRNAFFNTLNVRIY